MTPTPTPKSSSRSSRLHNPETGKLDLVKVGKWAGALTAIIGLLAMIGAAGWTVYGHMATVEDALEEATRANDRLDELELPEDPGAEARGLLADAVRSVDSRARARDAANARAVAVIGNTVDVLHGGTYRPVAGYGPPGAPPRGRAAQIAAARLAADRAASWDEGEDADDPEDPLAALEDF